MHAPALRNRLLCAIGVLVIHQACSSSDGAPGDPQAGQAGNAGAGGSLAGGSAPGGSGGSSAGAPSGRGGASAAGQAGAGAPGTGGAQAGGAGSAGAQMGGAGQGGAKAGDGGAQDAGSAGAAGSAGSSAGVAGAGGAEAAECPPWTTGEPTTICFGLDGKSIEPLEVTPEGPWGPSCPGLVRQAGDPCPGLEAFDSCVFEQCEVRSVILLGGPSSAGDQCCYDSSVCMGGAGCGRPLRVGGLSRRSSLAARGDWG